jgi:hypothetical protein
MFVFITIFGIALLATIIFIYVRIHNIRIGKIKVSLDHERKDRRVYTKVVETKEKTAWYGKNIFRLSILLILKFFVFIGFVFKQVFHEAKEYAKERFTPKKQSGNKKPSAFIGTIREYKKEIKCVSVFLGCKSQELSQSSSVGRATAL